jgi:radical SAM superfamily enzyme YgiQ (UPF0313 family)
MKDILFITPSPALSINLESNGTLLLATKLLHADFDVDILRLCQVESYHKDYESFIANAVTQISTMAPKCVSFYTLWPYYHVMIRMAQELRAKNPNMIIVFGGPQASATAEDTLAACQAVDYICSGEGENTVVPFFSALLRGKGSLNDIPGLYHRQGRKIIHNDQLLPLCDLEDLPRWDDRLYADVYREPPEVLSSSNYYMPIDAGRGCPYNCTFCCTSYFWRRTYRLKSPQRIVSDIRFFNEKFGINSFWFSHDAFTTDRNLVSQVCDYIIESGLKITWKCSSRADCINEELILKMKQAGLTEIEIGIETGSPRMQKLTHKNLNLDRVRQMIRFLVSQGLYVSLFFMYGFPEETQEDLLQTLELMFSLMEEGVDKLGMFFCRFNPATQITADYIDNLVLDPNITVLSKSIFGYNEELELIRSNKALFPYFYHLKTPLRDEFQHLTYLIQIYQKFPKTGPIIRKLYNSDYVKMYRDFVAYNPSITSGSPELVLRTASHPHEFLIAMLQGLDFPQRNQLAGRLTFEWDVQQVAKSEGDITIQRTYPFSYVDFTLKRPIEAYTDASCEILLENRNGKLSMKVLRPC